MARTGVLLLGFGGPDSIESVEPFMCNLMGKQPSPELVMRICGNYEAIGGASPLADIAARIARALEADLASLGHEAPVRVGMRYWHPYIDDTIESLRELGCEQIVTVSLSPFESKVTSGAYREAIAEALGEGSSVEVVEAPLISGLSAFADFYVESTRRALAAVPRGTRSVVAFTAHSLPVSDLVDDDPYVAGLTRTAEAVAAGLCLAPGVPDAGPPALPTFAALGSGDADRPWFLVFQSKGARPGAWLGPALDELIAASAEAGYGAVVVSPIGFVTDHMETLFDLDVVAANSAVDAGMVFTRAAVPNEDPGLVSALAKAVAPLI